MELSREDTIWVASKLVNYFADFKRIDDYFRARKIERVKDLPAPLFGFGLEDDMFQNYDMHPQDMNFEVTTIPNETFDAMLEKTASFSPDESPGKTMKLVVKETNTNTVVGFIRYGSPLINSKPRNDYLGSTPDLDIFNKRAIMGFNIVPVQPFGYNYLGGKLLAAICCSHETRRMLNAKYNTEFCLFETTSLYGNIKGASMYDGMRPFLRYKGDTQSKFLLTLGEELYFEEDIQVPLLEHSNKRDAYLHRIYKNQLKELSSEVFGTIKCMLEKLAYPSLVASHIKPFIVSDVDEAYDVDNGLLLSRNMDILFDLGYISFSDTGRIIYLDSLSSEVKIHIDSYNLDSVFLNDRRLEYLRYHREHIFKAGS